MADETIIERAMSILPGSRPRKKSTPLAATRKKQVADIQRKLAALTRDVGKLAGLIAGTDTKKASSRPTTRKSAARKARSSKPAKRRTATRSAKRPT